MPNLITPQPREGDPPVSLYEPIVVMGVAGCGKSTLGIAIAEAIGAAFVEADLLHPPENIVKMTKGIPLTDGDRWPWLDLVGQALQARDGSARGVVGACSALRRAYRDRIRAYAPETRFVHLTGAKALLLDRLQSRPGHFMPASLLDSQLATLEHLESDEMGVTIDIEKTLDEQLQEAAGWLDAQMPSSHSVSVIVAE